MKPSFPAGAAPLVFNHLGRVVLQVEQRSDREALAPDVLLDLLRSHPFIAASDDLSSAIAALQKAPFAEQQRRIASLPGPEGQLRALIALDLGQRNPSALFEQVLKLNSLLAEMRDESSRLAPLVITPEWLLSGAPVHLGGGGPGGYPRPVRNLPKGSAARRNRAWKIVPRSADAKLSDGAGVGVTVYVLDTAPCAHTMARAYTAWAAENELVERLLGPASPLRITYADYRDLLDLEPYGLQLHRFIMSDHGLFVAGLIHGIVPEARLELIEVLNPYGIGTTLTIAKGLEQVARQVAQSSGQALVLNMSLMITLPRPDDLQRLKQEDPQSWDGYDDKAFATLCAQLAADVERQLGGYCSFLYEKGVLLAAAAGNDAEGGQRPPARFPAAFARVVGVGAVDPNDVPTPYSNRSDEPTTAEAKIIATFGGDVERSATLKPPQTAEKRGMLGIYIGDFPNRPKRAAPANTNGWAWWSGTSFAAPIIAGFMARLRSAGLHTLAPAQAEQMIADAAITTTGEPNEVVFPVIQVA